MSLFSKGILYFFISFLFLIFVLIGFNWQADPMCYYRCNEIKSDKRTLNRYYKKFQYILNNPTAQAIALGSSRGETVSEKYLTQKLGFETLNLSVAGGEFFVKSALSRFAADKLSLKKVIWLADYFEFNQMIADPLVTQVPAIQKLFNLSTTTNQNLFSMDLFFETIKTLIDHNTFEASLASYKSHNIEYISESNTPVSTERLNADIASTLQHYVNKVFILRPQQQHQQQFENLIRQTPQLQWAIVIAPYHPRFTQYIKENHLPFYEDHMNWIKWLKHLETQNPNMKVYNAFDGIINDDGSTKYWNDGVHFNNSGAEVILNQLDI